MTPPRPRPRTLARYGWHPSLPDHRDHLLTAASWPQGPLPPAVDLRHLCGPIYDQGQLGSCTAQALAAALAFDQHKQGLPAFLPSRLMIYYEERVIERSVPYDAGASLSDGLAAVFTLGACSEEDWPYDIARFTARPPAACYVEAAGHKATEYARVPQDIALMRSSLAAGDPFVFGFSVYDSFESDVVAATGDAPYPQAGEVLLGGHAVLAVGYADAGQRLLCRNSWGSVWGQGGYFTLPYAYVANPNLAADFWRITFVANKTETT